MNITLSEYYKTEHWQNIRKVVQNKHKVCQRCGSHRKLNVHHGSYANLYKEDVETELFLLCELCHNRYHITNNKITIESTIIFIEDKVDKPIQFAVKTSKARFSKKKYKNKNFTKFNYSKAISEQKEERSRSLRVRLAKKLITQEEFNIKINKC